MAQVEQQGQPGQVADFDQAVESVKIEKNSRGYNFSFRVNKKEGQIWQDVLDEIDALNGALVRRFGENR